MSSPRVSHDARPLHERRSGGDRRSFARGGRRATDVLSLSAVGGLLASTLSISSEDVAAGRIVLGRSFTSVYDTVIRFDPMGERLASPYVKAGVLAVVAAPVAGMLIAKVDPRRLIFGGLMWLAFVTMLRAGATTDMHYWQIAWPLILMGAGRSELAEHERLFDRVPSVICTSATLATATSIG